MKFKLIKEYPDSPELGTITDESYGFKTSNHGIYYPSLDWFKKYPKFWEEVKSDEPKDEHIKPQIKDILIDKFYEWIGKENLRFFKHLKGLTGTYAPVLRLNEKRKGVPVYPVHLKDGMHIRNWMRSQYECRDWIDHDFDDNWTELIGATINKFMNKTN